MLDCHWFFVFSGRCHHLTFSIVEHIFVRLFLPWRHHSMEIFSALLALCGEIYRLPAIYLHKTPVLVFFYIWIGSRWTNSRVAGDSKRSEDHVTSVKWPDVLHCIWPRLGVWNCLIPYSKPITSICINIQVIQLRNILVPCLGASKLSDPIMSPGWETAKNIMGCSTNCARRSLLN